jgi:hypothetical protein
MWRNETLQQDPDNINKKNNKSFCPRKRLKFILSFFVPKIWFDWIWPSFSAFSTFVDYVHSLLVPSIKHKVQCCQIISIEFNSDPFV